MAQKHILSIVATLAAVLSLLAVIGISINSVTAQNMTGNETGGNMTAGANMTNTTMGDIGNMTSSISPTPTQ